MKELQEIVKAYDAAKNKGAACVLATVVQLKGSSYRRPGARMLVLEDGLMIGSISGGCLEGDALKKALLTFSEKQSRLVTYDTSDEEDVTVGIQLGCEGVIQVLFEYIDSSNPKNPIELLRNAIDKRQNAVLVTLFDLINKKNNQVGTSYLLEQRGEMLTSLIDKDVIESIQSEAALVLQNEQSAFKKFTVNQNEIHAFVEFIAPPISLVVVGAGNDAVPLMQMASLLGWEVKVVDGRSTHAKSARFIQACQVLVSKPEKVVEQINIDSRTCFVLMTHNYNYDLQMLKALLATSVRYIGILGPRKKLMKMLQEFQQEGFMVTESMLSRIYGPTGLDIGAETSEEIAASIIAEIHAVLNGKNGNMLKFKQDVIHS